MPLGVEPHVGKKSGQSLVATNTSSPPLSHLLHVADHKSGLRFLIDTVAEASIIPPSHTNRKHRQGLQAVNGSPIATYGQCSATLNLGLQQIFLVDVHHC